MVSARSIPPTLDLIIERITASGRISHQEHQQLISAILSNQLVTNNQRRRINQVLDYIQTGRLKLVLRQEKIEE